MTLKTLPRTACLVYLWVLQSNYNLAFLAVDRLALECWLSGISGENSLNQIPFLVLVIPGVETVFPAVVIRGTACNPVEVPAWVN